MCYSHASVIMWVYVLAMAGPDLPHIHTIAVEHTGTAERAALNTNDPV